MVKPPLNGKVAFFIFFLLVFTFNSVLSSPVVSDADLSQGICEYFGYVWTGLGGQENCCGDDGEEDTYLVNSTHACISGELKGCTTNCTYFVVDNNVYYCLFGKWVENPPFSGTYLRRDATGNSYGCCDYEECWDGNSCVRNSTVVDTWQCCDGVWRYIQTEAPPSQQSVVSNTTQQPTNPCEGAVCGAPCEGGVCNGLGACVPLAKEGESCYCSGMCEPGLICGKGNICTRATSFCGDGICEQEECATGCKEDCNIEKCINNGNCDVAIGENCMNSPDCQCTGNLVCEPENANANAWGCVAKFCGNGVCDPGECATGCRQDCSPVDCLGNGNCDVAIGENCMNSPDCQCNFSIELWFGDDLVVGIHRKGEIRIRNIGDAEALIRPLIECNGCEVYYENVSIALKPGEERIVEFELIPRTKEVDMEVGVLEMKTRTTAGGSGFHSSYVVRGKTRKVELSARDPTPTELFTSIVESPISFILDAWDLIAAIFGIGFAIVKIFGLGEERTPIYYPSARTYLHYYYYPYRRRYASAAIRYPTSSGPHHSFFQGTREGQRRD